MSNTATAFGFKHFGYLPGGAPDYQLSTRLIASSNTTSIYFGDPVAKVANTQYIQAQTVTTGIVDGIFQGCMLIPSTGGAPTFSPFYPGAAGADVTAYVIEAPNAMFLAATQTNIASTNIGATVAFKVGAGSTIGGGFSGYVLDSASISTTVTTNAFQIVGLYGLGNGNFGAVGNGSDYTSANNFVIVTFNSQRFRTLVGV